LAFQFLPVWTIESVFESKAFIYKVLSQWFSMQPPFKSKELNI